MPARKTSTRAAAVDCAQEFADSGVLFASQYSISIDDQKEIIDRVRSSGAISKGAAKAGLKEFWRLAPLRMPLVEGLPPKVRRSLSSRPPSALGKWAFYNRLYPDVEWAWTDDACCETVRRVLRPLEPLIRRLTWVIVLLQVPGEAVPVHRDFVPGTRHMSREDNLFLSLKIPLSEHPDRPGQPYIIQDGRKHHYSSKSRLFFLNESAVMHGADAVDYWRGVVFVSALWNVDEIRRLRKLPAEIQSGLDGL